MDNETPPDGLVDDRDPECEGPGDDDEATLGNQPQLPICRNVVIRIERPQAVELPQPSCPECNLFELIDFGLLLDAPISQIFESLPDKWEASTPLTSKPAPGVLDDPNIPNLRLRYTGNSQILGPAVVGGIKLREPFVLPPNVKYVGRAFNTQTGQIVTNVGTLSLGITQKPAVRPLVPMLGLVVLLGIVIGAVWLYRSRQRRLRE